MSSDVRARPAAAPASTAPDVRRAYRDTSAPLLGGVAAGLARHLGVPVLGVRVGFVLASALGGLGVALYAALWLMLPARRETVEAPGLAAARRGGRRPGRMGRLTDAGPAIALAALGIGLLLLVEAAGGQGSGLWPLVLALAGVALVWRQADEAQRERWLDATGRVGARRVVLGAGGWAAYARLVVGAALIALAVVVFALRDGSLVMARDVGVAALLGVVGIGVVVGPWAFRLVAELGEERAERVRNQDRADVAAHLHDSVLQTLALIQKNAGDAGAVSRLARAQERDLRSWLFVGDTLGGGTLVGQLREAAATVEDAHGVAVDVVAVGDRDLGPDDVALRAVVAATREAVTNAAKHAGTDRVDVYAEVTDARVEVFVRDRGRGFEVAGVPADRLGVRGSIVDRMRRHGGAATVRTGPGQGTEVRLRVPGDADTGTDHAARPDPTHPADHPDRPSYDAPVQEDP